MTLPTPFYEEDRITIYCADCRTILPLLPKVDLVLTDPPWELNDSQIEIRGTGVAPRRQASKTIKQGCIGRFDASVISQLNEQSDHDCLFLCGYKELADVIKACPILRGVFAWHKPNGAPAAFYPAKMDLSFIVWSGKKSLIYGHQHWPSMVFSFPFPPAGCFASERFTDPSGKAIHPCQGPIELYRCLINPFPADAVILDAYLGTGTTLRAAKDLGRRAIGIEISEEYCKIAVERLRQGVLKFA